MSKTSMATAQVARPLSATAAVFVTQQAPTTNLDKTLATVHFMANHNDTAQARKELYQQGIKTSYNENVMIFSKMRSAKNSLNNLYIQECNGLILEQNTWKPLVVPPRSLRYNINTESSNKYLHQGLYHIYKAQDGTCFNLYYYLNKWIISTTSGHTMNAVSWANGKSYQAIISECLEHIGLTWETFTSQLDTTYCYSFGFRHPLMHKFQENVDEPVYKIWFIQSVCLNEEAEYLWTNDASPIAIIPSQEVETSIVNNLRELYKTSSNALQNYLDNKTICYGFILRSVNVSQTGEHSDLYIESSLMRTIRRICYENSLIEQCHKNNWNKELAITLHSYLDMPNYEIFCRLFPSYSEKMQVYHRYVSDVVSNMVQLTTNNAYQPVNHAEVSRMLLQMFHDNVRLQTKGLTAENLNKIYFEYISHSLSLSTMLEYSSTYLQSVSN